MLNTSGWQTLKIKQTKELNRRYIKFTIITIPIKTKANILIYNYKKKWKEEEVKF
jgi:hypothetical protein